MVLAAGCDGKHTLLFPATKQDPSIPSVTERIGMSPAGVCGRSNVNKGGRAQQRAYKFVGAGILRQIPLFDTSSLVAGYKFSLVWVYHDVVDWMA